MTTAERNAMVSDLAARFVALSLDGSSKAAAVRGEGCMLVGVAAWRRAVRRAIHNP